MPAPSPNLSLSIAAVSVFLTVFLLITGLNYRNESLEERLKRFTAIRPIANSSAANEKTLKDILTHLGKFTPQRWRTKLDRELIQGDIPLRGGEFLVIQELAAFMLFLVGILLTRSLSVSLLFLGVGVLLPHLYLAKAKKKKRKQFDNQLADSLLILANSLHAGFSLLQAMEMVGQEMPNPIAGEFKITLREMTFGAPTETALTNLAERVGSDDLDLLVTAVLIQRQVGGNLAEVLINIHSTIADRIRIQQELKTLTAQGRMSGYIIGALPFGIAGILSIINPSYLKLLFTTSLGLAMLFMGLTSQLIGFFIIHKIISVKA